MITSPHITEPKHLIETEWSLDDLYDAHDVIEVLDKLEELRTAPPKK